MSTIIRKAKDPEDDFPAARRIGAHGIGWIEEEIDAWIESRAKVRAFEVDHLETESGDEFVRGGKA